MATDVYIIITSQPNKYYPYELYAMNFMKWLWL